MTLILNSKIPPISVNLAVWLFVLANPKCKRNPQDRNTDPHVTNEETISQRPSSTYTKPSIDVRI